MKGEIARSAAEEAKKKALEDLKAERARSRSLSDDVDRLKRALLETKARMTLWSGVCDSSVCSFEKRRAYSRRVSPDFCLHLLRSHELPGRM